MLLTKSMLQQTWPESLTSGSKVRFEHPTETHMVNAHVVYRKDSQRKVSLLDFMKSGIKLFTDVESEPQRGRHEHYDRSLAIERQHFQLLPLSLFIIQTFHLILN